MKFILLTDVYGSAQSRYHQVINITMTRDRGCSEKITMGLICQCVMY